ncbi:hypothetical protein E1287_21075 [Actinomadura sp. KC06]|nr:hypothetical protein E1287_21075 [Actinomadura sp. KC06]
MPAAGIAGTRATCAFLTAGCPEPSSLVPPDCHHGGCACTSENGGRDLEEDIVPTNGNSRRRLARRLARMAAFAFVRGAAAACGGGLVALIIWWIQNH